MDFVLVVYVAVAVAVAVAVGVVGAVVAAGVGLIVVSFVQLEKLGAGSTGCH